VLDSLQAQADIEHEERGKDAKEERRRLQLPLLTALMMSGNK
jgi:hypothetical protein